jgi:hypothetical protein
LNTLVGGDGSDNGGGLLNLLGQSGKSYKGGN